MIHVPFWAPLLLVGSACATFIEAGKSLGYKVGVVTNARVTHATPASFIAHNGNRNNEDEIAFSIARNVSYDLLFGGGRSHFNNREDGVDLINSLEETHGFSYISSKSQLASANLPVLGLFANSHLDFELDRLNDPGSTQPSHSEMVSSALNILSAQHDDDQPFMLIVEAGKIDLSSHNNDPSTHYWEVHEYQNTIRGIIFYRVVSSIYVDVHFFFYFS